MKLKKMKIRNYRCCSDLEIDILSMHAIVGANNAGKSTLLHALDLLFNPSVRKLSEESFYEKDLTRRIEIEGVFGDLTEQETRELAPYLKPDGTFHIMRTAESVPDLEGLEDSKFRIQPHYATHLPRIEWLNPTKISGAAITEWWAKKDELVIGGVRFTDSVPGTAKPQVAAWKELAEAFAAAHLGSEDYEQAWVANPQGYAGVLKATLPHFELIPAVRDATDESKVTKTNPFGRLIYEIVDSLDGGLRGELEATLQNTLSKLNRGAAARAPKIGEVEASINGFLAEIMPVDLELQFQAPTVEVLLTTPKILVDDGFSGAIEGKGHGLQRAVIFAILRAYAKLITERSQNEKRTLILGVEEPELYMHPTAQRTIRRVLRAIADSGDQVLVTTHSPLMVDVQYFDEIIRMEKSGSELSPVPHQLSVAALIEDLECRLPSLKGRISEQSIRERYRHVYTPTRNEGFFAKTVVLVEGQTELYALPVYARASGVDFDARSIAVVECGGKGQIDRLYRIFNELGIPCYVVFDYDVDNTDPNCRRETRGLLEIFGSDLQNPTATEINPSFACFAKNWEEDLSPQIAEYAKYKADATEELGIRGDAGKPLIARYVAMRVCEGEAPAVPPILDELIQRISAVERTASCLIAASATSASSAVIETTHAVDRRGRAAH